MSLFLSYLCFYRETNIFFYNFNFSFLFRPLEMKRNFIFAFVLVFCFHVKSGATNNHRNGSSDISY